MALLTAPTLPVRAPLALVTAPTPLARASIASIGACQGCGACLLTCPTAAIRPVRRVGASGSTTTGAVLSVREDLCTGCAECVEVCPVDAIDLVPRGAGR